MGVGRPLLASVVWCWPCRYDGNWVGTSSGGSSFWDQSSPQQDPTIIKPCICWVTLSSSLNCLKNEYHYFSEKNLRCPNPLKTFLWEIGSSFFMSLSPIYWIWRKNKRENNNPHVHPSSPPTPVPTSLLSMPEATSYSASSPWHSS